MLSWNDVLVRKSDVITRASDDELVVVLPEQGKFIVLNATGARVLALSDGACTLRQIAVAIANEFDADQAIVEGDVLRFAETLVEREVLTLLSREKA